MTTPSYYPLPTTLDGITADWLTAALRQRTPDVTVQAVKIVDVNRGTCSKIRLQLQVGERGKLAGIPDTVILKGGFEPHSQELWHMHEREVRSYRDLFPQLPLPTPTCYFADFDKENQQGIIILEDLVASEARFCHALTPQTFDEVAARLQVLARFHARTWRSPELEPGGKWSDLVDFLGIIDDFFARKTAVDTWERFCNSPRGAACSVRFLDRDWMLDAWAKLKRFSDSQAHCVLHGDIHLGNLYVSKSGEPGFFDPLASTGPGLIEVAYHICGSVDFADRARWEGALVQHYLDELGRCGADAPGFDDAMHQYAIYLVYAHFIWLTTEPHYQAEAVSAAATPRVCIAMLDHDTDDKLKAMAI